MLPAVSLLSSLLYEVLSRQGPSKLMCPTLTQMPDAPLPFTLQVVWHGYVQSMRQALFSPDLGLYVASGLLTYGANDGEHWSSLLAASRQALWLALRSPRSWSCLVSTSDIRLAALQIWTTSLRP